MSSSPVRTAQRLLSDADLAFITEDKSIAPSQLVDLRQALATDEALRAEVLGADRLFRRILSFDEAFVHISPRLFFEVLLRRAVQELGRAAHILERAGSQRLPVFLDDDAVKVVARPVVLDYLADMLSSFTRIESHTVRVRVRRGVWRKSRYSDLDVASLLRLASETEETHRLPVYKRIGDASLLVIGIFPDFPATATRYPGTGALRRRGERLTTEEYEDIAARAYRTAAEHPSAESPLAEAVLLLSEHVIDAKRPLNHLADQYLRFRRTQLFGASG
jgi:hypothetical protein